MARIHWGVLVGGLAGSTLFYLINLQMAYPATSGKDIFKEYKCQGCHTVKSQGIAKEEIKDEEEEEEESDDQKKVDPPDQSDLCSRKDSKIECTETFLDGFLRKKITNKKGDKHKKRFKGSPEERKVLIEWLMTLKE